MIASLTRIRRATEAGAEVVASIIAQGFLTDPTIEWIFSDPATRRQYTGACFRLFVAAVLPASDVFVDPDAGTAAIWLPVDPAAPQEDDAALMEVMAGGGLAHTSDGWSRCSNR